MNKSCGGTIVGVGLKGGGRRTNVEKKGVSPCVKHIISKYRPLRKQMCGEVFKREGEVWGGGTKVTKRETTKGQSRKNAGKKRLF